MDELRQDAEALLTGQWMDISQLSPDALQRMFHELRAHQIELQMQNEELRRAQTELEAARRKYADLYNFAPVGYGTVDQDGTIVELNLTAATQLEQPRDALIGMRFYHYIAADDRDAFFLCLRKAFDSHAHEACELRLLKQTGAFFWAQIEGLVMLETNYCHLTFTDITERKRIEDALRISEAQFRTLAQIAPIGIYLTDANGACRYVNPCWCQIAGMSPNDALGMGWLNAISPENREFIFLKWKKMVESASEWELEYRLQAPDGLIKWVYGTATPQHDDAGIITGYIGVTLDITERKQQEQAILDMVQRLQATIETIAEGITLSDEEGSFVIYNSKMEEITGYSREDANHASDFLTLLHPDPAVRTRIAADLQRLLSQGGEQTVETVIRAKNGTDKTLIVSTTLLQEKRKPLFLSAYRDITPLKDVERQLQHEARIKGELLREVNHRVGNNLMAISGLLSLERRHLALEAHAAYQEILEDLTSRVNSLAKVHEMLSLSEWSPLALDDLCEQVIRSSMQQAPLEKRLIVTVHPSPVRVTAKQAHHLALILNELTTNSVKYTLQNRDCSRITLHISCDEQQIQIQFQDDGPGYPDDVLTQQRYNVGLDLVFKLSRYDLRGDYALKNDGGAVTMIRFPVAAFA